MALLRLTPAKLPVAVPALLAVRLILPLVLVMLEPELRVILRSAFKVRLFVPLLRATLEARSIVVPKMVVGEPKVVLLVRFTVPVVRLPKVMLLKPAGIVAKLGVKVAPVVKGAIVKLPVP